MLFVQRQKIRLKSLVPTTWCTKKNLGMLYKKVINISTYIHFIILLINFLKRILLITAKVKSTYYLLNLNAVKFKFTLI